jgi:hypothetical protein
MGHGFLASGEGEGLRSGIGVVCSACAGQPWWRAGTLFTDRGGRAFCKKMPVWVIELFGNAELNRAFWMMNFAVMPFWALMIFLPRQRWVQTLSNPFFVPVLFGLVYLYAIYLLVNITGVPPLAGLEVRAMRKFVDHPLVFLVVWAHYLAVDLFLGMTIFQDATRRKILVPLELLLCWVLGPLGLLAYVLRLGWLKVTLR